MRRLGCILIVLLLAAHCRTSIAQVDTETCSLAAIAKLPQLPRLHIVATREHNPKDNPKGLSATAKIVDIDVRAAGIAATYSFICDNVDGELVTTRLDLR
jgi:hypothetical protein